jgi:hypothetical protein
VKKRERRWLIGSALALAAVLFGAALFFAIAHVRPGWTRGMVSIRSGDVIFVAEGEGVGAPGLQYGAFYHPYPQRAADRGAAYYRFQFGSLRAPGVTAWHVLGFWIILW